jgi:hypothetical protein
VRGAGARLLDPPKIQVDRCSFLCALKLVGSAEAQ